VAGYTTAPGQQTFIVLLSWQKAKTAEVPMRKTLLMAFVVTVLMCCNSYAALYKFSFETIQPLTYAVPDIQGWLIADLTMPTSSNPQIQYSSSKIKDISFTALYQGNTYNYSKNELGPQTFVYFWWPSGITFPSVFGMGGSGNFLTDSTTQMKLNISYPGNYMQLDIFPTPVSPGKWTTSAVPVPGAVWLLGSAMIGLFGLRRRTMAS
jgi:hypothetical protein